MENKLIKLLWTGGWDSTFRLIELSRKSVTIQPIYLYGDGRKSVEYELYAMQKILDALLKHPCTFAEILPLKKIDISYVPDNQQITQAYKNIIKTYKLGSQYEWIARYAAIDPGIEICVEKPHENGIGYMQKVIASEGKLSPTRDIHRYKVDTRSEDIGIVLSNVYFPIMDISEQDMLNLINEWKYQDIMKHIWFCHSPIKGQPCGMCRPCCEKIEAEMSFLLPKEAKMRNKIYKLLGCKLSKVFEHIVRKLVGNNMHII